MLEKKKNGKIIKCVIFIGKSIFLFAETLEWNLKNTTVGGLIDEKIVIDCGASGEPEPRIIITDEKGANLSGY